MLIRNAVVNDARPIAQVHLASWKTTYPGLIPQEYIDGLRVEKGTADWQAALSSGRTTVLVAEDEKTVVGFAAGGAIAHAVDGYEGELGAIYLLASHQRRGIGAALLRRMAAELQGKGLRNMAVWVLRENPACGFYRRLGGIQVGEQTIEIGGRVLPEIAYGWPEIGVLCEDELAHG
ncbi:MAG TPA: GNAT family N-acetyltransferase [Acidobacteriaceae bacterium]|nr:GNAT family N-acetyltransferase [Acidobacteriaceae bacterium]